MQWILKFKKKETKTITITFFMKVKKHPTCRSPSTALWMLWNTKRQCRTPPKMAERKNSNPKMIIKNSRSTLCVLFKKRSSFWNSSSQGDLRTWWSEGENLSPNKVKDMFCCCRCFAVKLIKMRHFQVPNWFNPKGLVLALFRKKQTNNGGN